MSNKRLSWLPFLTNDIPADFTSPAQVARFELNQGLPDVNVTLCEQPDMGDAYAIAETDGKVTVTGGATGVLYGAYALIMARKAGWSIPGSTAPRYSMRMINCWDNMSGDIERGYAGRSLWFEANKFDYDPARIRQLGRMLASVGLNVLCINNVNVHEPAQGLIEDLLPELARFADILRPFGVRLMVSIDYSQPMRHGIPTADPLDERVQQWWANQAKIVWDTIPDLAGFLVKADSEHRPGPFSYGRNHAEGANMLARAIKPYGGKLIWRCFVYNCQQDWRDQTTDRPMAAYQHYVWLDGQFDDNVILQVKNGPYDFQVREAISPTLLAMPNTNLAIEFQLAQEYTGQQRDIFAMQPMWKETFDVMPADKIMSIAAVSNLGRDDNYTGHPFAAANLFGYGLLAWDPTISPEESLRLWARLSYALPKEQEDELTDVMLRSRGIYEKYAANLGLCWMVTPNSHYGPNPSGYEYQAWGTYHRANREAVGIDRTAKGTGYTEQYGEPLRSLYADLATCPDNLLLFFHRLPYDYVMRDGRTLIQRLYDDHFEGLTETQQMALTLGALDLPEPDRDEVRARLEIQLANAREWCDITNTFFYRLSGVKDAKGRTIYE